MDIVTIYLKGHFSNNDLRCILLPRARGPSITTPRQAALLSFWSGAEGAGTLSPRDSPSPGVLPVSVSVRICLRSAGLNTNKARARGAHSGAFQHTAWQQREGHCFLSA